jgi:transketolase
LPILERNGDYTSTVGRGAYILADSDGEKPDVIIMASGSEVQHAVEAKKLLRAQYDVDARVVSFPSWELFEAQPDEYKDEVLPPDVTARLAVEAGVTMGWERYVGDAGQVIGLNRFGASAPYKENFAQFGFTADNVVLQALGLVDKSRK